MERVGLIRMGKVRDLHDEADALRLRVADLLETNADLGTERDMAEERARHLGARVAELETEEVFMLDSYEAKLEATWNVRLSLEARVAELEAALIRLRDCDWVITLPDRMDAVRGIACAAIAASENVPHAAPPKP